MSLEPICAYVYINDEIIHSSNANTVFRSDKTKSISLNPTMRQSVKVLWNLDAIYIIN